MPGDFASMDTGPVEEYAAVIEHIGQAIEAWAEVRERINDLRPAIGAGPMTAVFLADYTAATDRIIPAADPLPRHLHEVAAVATAAVGMYLAADGAGRIALGG